MREIYCNVYVHAFFYRHPLHKLLWVQVRSLNFQASPRFPSPIYSTVCSKVNEKESIVAWMFAISIASMIPNCSEKMN